MIPKMIYENKVFERVDLFKKYIVFRTETASRENHHESNRFISMIPSID